MELHQLTYFVATAESGSVSRAARLCHVAQPSLSQQIRKLEAGLGVRLFDRLGRGMTLTEDGQALLPRARRILAEVRSLNEHLRADVASGAGVLRVGVIPTVAPFVAPPALRHVRQVRPACEIAIHENLTERLIEAVVDHELDCAIVSTPIDHARVEVEVLGAEELVLAAPLTWRDRVAPGALRLAELRDEAVVALHDFHCLGRQIREFCATRQLTPRVRCHAAQLATVFDLVALGLGVSIVPEMAAAAQGGRRWRYVRFAGGELRREVAVAWRRDRTRPGAALEFVSAVRQWLADGRGRLPNAGRSAQRAGAKGKRGQ